jgi:hypothetical protein
MPKTSQSSNGKNIQGSTKERAAYPDENINIADGAKLSNCNSQTGNLSLNFNQKAHSHNNAAKNIITVVSELPILADQEAGAFKQDMLHGNVLHDNTTEPDDGITTTANNAKPYNCNFKAGKCCNQDTLCYTNDAQNIITTLSKPPYDAVVKEACIL